MKFVELHGLTRSSLLGRIHKYALCIVGLACRVVEISRSVLLPSLWVGYGVPNFRGRDRTTLDEINEISGRCKALRKRKPKQYATEETSNRSVRAARVCSLYPLYFAWTYNYICT